MRLRRTCTLLVVLIALTAPTRASQDLERKSVWIGQTGSDRVGSAVAYQLREKLAASRIFSLARSRDEAMLRIDLLSVDVGVPDPGLQSAVSIAYFGMPNGSRFLNHGVAITGGDRTQTLAVELLGSLDKLTR